MKPALHAISSRWPLLPWGMCIFFLMTGICRSGDYILGPGDVIKISVYDNDDLLTVTRISDQGFVIMPLLGQVKVQGLTVPQAAAQIGRLLADGYLIDPQVNIFVQEFRSKKAIVLGHVNRPGLIEMSGPTTLLELISKAGGLADDFGETVTIKRSVDGRDNVILADLKSLTVGGDLSHNIPIQDGDTVYVSKAGMCYVTGEVKSPNAYKCGHHRSQADHPGRRIHRQGIQVGRAGDPDRQRRGNGFPGCGHGHAPAAGRCDRCPREFILMRH